MPELILPALWHKDGKTVHLFLSIDTGMPNPFARHRTIGGEVMSRSVGSSGTCPELPVLCVFTAGSQIIWCVKAPANKKVSKVSFFASLQVLDHYDLPYCSIVKLRYLIFVD